MKKVIIMAAAIAALCVGAATAEASATWPAACKTFKCVNSHLNALHKQNVTLKSQLTTARSQLTTARNRLACFAKANEFPLGFWGDPNNGVGYLWTFDNGASASPLYGLSVYINEPSVAWAGNLVVDGCNPNPPKASRSPFVNEVAPYVNH